VSKKGLVLFAAVCATAVSAAPLLGAADAKLPCPCPGQGHKHHQKTNSLVGKYEGTTEEDGTVSFRLTRDARIVGFTLTNERRCGTAGQRVLRRGRIRNGQRADALSLLAEPHPGMGSRHGVVRHEGNRLARQEAGDTRVPSPRRASALLTTANRLERVVGEPLRHEVSGAAALVAEGVHVGPGAENAVGEGLPRDVAGDLPRDLNAKPR
jgi:hypothetical protein